jgi:hypothetical protein
MCGCIFQVPYAISSHKGTRCKVVGANRNLPNERNQISKGGVEVVVREVSYKVKFSRIRSFLLIALEETVQKSNFCKYFYLSAFIIIVSGVRLSPLGTPAATGLLYQPQMIDDGDCGAIS